MSSFPFIAVNTCRLNWTMQTLFLELQTGLNRWRPRIFSTDTSIMGSFLCTSHENISLLHRICFCVAFKAVWSFFDDFYCVHGSILSAGKAHVHISLPTSCVCAKLEMFSLCNVWRTLGRGRAVVLTPTSITESDTVTTFKLHSSLFLSFIVHSQRLIYICLPGQRWSSRKKLNSEEPGVVLEEGLSQRRSVFSLSIICAAILARVL